MITWIEKLSEIRDKYEKEIEKIKKKQTEESVKFIESNREQNPGGYYASDFTE